MCNLTDAHILGIFSICRSPLYMHMWTVDVCMSAHGWTHIQVYLGRRLCTSVCWGRRPVPRMPTRPYVSHRHPATRCFFLKDGGKLLSSYSCIILDPRFFPLPPPVRKIMHSKSIMSSIHFRKNLRTPWCGHGSALLLPFLPLTSPSGAK